MRHSPSQAGFQVRREVLEIHRTQRAFRRQIISLDVRVVATILTGEIDLQGNESCLENTNIRIEVEMSFIHLIQTIGIGENIEEELTRNALSVPVVTSRLIRSISLDDRELKNSYDDSFEGHRSQKTEREVTLRSKPRLRAIGEH